MAEYIEREKSIKIAESYGLKNGSALGRHSGIADCIAEAISIIPSADVAPVKHGRWVKNVRGDYSIVCSECGYGFPTDGYAWMECNRRSDEREYCFKITDVKNYCPNCGAQMDEEA